jgi:hypothetical protein
MSGIAYRLAGGVYAVNSAIVLVVNNVVSASVVGAGIYVLITSNGLDKLYALLAVPALFIAPTLANIVVGLPLGFVHYVLTGYFVRERARQEYAVLDFISKRRARVWGAPLQGGGQQVRPGSPR